MKEWFAKVHSLGITPGSTLGKEVIICPSFPLLSVCKSLIANYDLPFALGSQDVSAFPEGAYTGAVNARQVKEFASYVIVGHSERRQNFGEDDAVIERKVAKAIEHQLTPIFCVQNETIPIPAGATIVTYEPIFAIGTGKPDTPENANIIAAMIKKNKSVTHVLYGGSVSPNNVGQFMGMEYLNGVLVGTASLDPATFLQIVTHA